MKTIIHFDRIKINSLLDPKTLKKSLPMEELKKNSYSCQVEKAEYKAAITGYSSRLDFSAPNSKFLKILFDHEKALGTHFISYIEIAKDEIYPTKQQALQATYDFSCRKKWATKHWTYVSEVLPKTDSDKFGLYTNYSENKYHGHKTYGRYSKITGQPCFHREWHFSQPHTIKAKTGIHEIGDLLAFNHQAFFEIHDEKYLIFDERPDQKKVGIWALNWTQRKEHFSKRELIIIGCHGAVIIGNRSAGELVQKFRGWKKAIKAKRDPRNIYGSKRKTKWDRQVLGIKDYRKFM